MNTDILNKAEAKFIRKDLPEFEVGDTIAVYTIIREKGKERVQVFKGIVIAIKGSGARKTFTIRKISSGIGVEKIFPLNSTNIQKIEFIKKGKVKKSKLYYMRKRIGKQATKIAEGVMGKTMKEQHESLIAEEEPVTPEQETASTTSEEQPKEEAKNEEPKANEEKKPEEKSEQTKTEEPKKD